MNTYAPLISPEIKIRNRILDLTTPKIMGVLNLTPDSFSDGGEFNGLEAALGRIELMISQGAYIIDIGGESTRPGSEAISAAQELARIVPVLEKAIPQFPQTFFSVDTTKFDVAEKALQLGVHIVNDISGLKREPRLAPLCKKYGAGYILMHSQGKPKIMQQNPVYDDVIEDIKSFFKKQIKQAEQAGVQPVIIDPGIGFGKTDAHDKCILNHLNEFKELGYPLLIGASRKRIIGSMLGSRPASDRLTGTVVAHYQAMLNGADIIRVHDVKEAKDSMLVYNALAEG
jgi:dihydropteroate synthase